MADQTTESTEAAEVEEAAPVEEPQGAETNWKAECRKWEARAKANKAKADQWDAQEEANKTELQRASEQLAKYKAELDGIKAKQARAAEVAKAAERHGVSADLLARMEGDVDENAKFLADMNGSARLYPQTRDMGERGKTKANDGMAQAAQMLFGRK